MKSLALPNFNGGLMVSDQLYILWFSFRCPGRKKGLPVIVNFTTTGPQNWTSGLPFFGIWENVESNYTA